MSSSYFAERGRPGIKKQDEGASKRWRLGPEVVHLAVGLSISDEAGSHLVEHESAVGTLEAGRVPFEVRRHSQDELIEDRTAASGTRARPSNS